MNRAFVKEDDGAPEEIPERRVSEHPNHVTPAGLEQLRERVAALEERRHELVELGDDDAAQNALRYVDRDLRYFSARIGSAIVVDLARQPRGEIAFGATATVRDAGGVAQRYTIVGEDEADPDRGKVSWVSPLGVALTGAGVGETVAWRRPAGTVRLTVEKIEY